MTLGNCLGSLSLSYLFEKHERFYDSTVSKVKNIQFYKSD